MLILTRKEGEAIVIDGKIEIKLLEIEDGKVKIGIEAPKDIEILRKEIYLQTQEENLEAGKVNISPEDLRKVLLK